jgi:hypothetical protein
MTDLSICSGDQNDFFAHIISLYLEKNAISVLPYFGDIVIAAEAMLLILPAREKSSLPMVYR